MEGCGMEARSGVEPD